MAIRNPLLDQVVVNKFGRNPDIDASTAADIWDGGPVGGTLIWLAPTAARIHQITSTDATDTAGTGTLTLTAGPDDTETVTCGTKVYTFQEILTDVDGNVFIGPDATATGVFTSAAVLADGDTVTIGSKVYTFQDILTDVDGNVFIEPDGTATGTLTSAAVFSDGDTVTLGSKVYTMQLTLTDVDGNVFIEPNATATQTLTLTENAADTNTVTIGSKVYTFQTSLTDVDGNVLIGANASDSIDNLLAGINGDAGAGSTYAASMVTNTDVTAAAGAAVAALGALKPQPVRVPRHRYDPRRPNMNRATSTNRTRAARRTPVENENARFAPSGSAAGTVAGSLSAALDVHRLNGSRFSAASRTHAGSVSMFVPASGSGSRRTAFPLGGIAPPSARSRMPAQMRFTAGDSARSL